MRRGLLLAIACAAAGSIAAQPPPRLRADGRRLATADGRTFEWRGVTAFRLVDHVADGRKDRAAAYLEWARGTGFTIVRVLTRIDWQDAPELDRAALSAEDGARHLPVLLAMAAERGLYVEAVATVGSGSTPYDWRAHARSVAEICAAADNCLFEFANEPGHPTQTPELHDMRQVDRLASEAARELPGLVWTAGPSWAGHSAAAPAGAYVVRHLEREGRPIPQIARLRELADLSARLNKLVVSDEPTGADEEDGARTGRQRWNDPNVFFAMGALCRGFALGCTFHLQDGLATVVPGPVQRKSAAAFVAGWRAMPAGSGDYTTAGAANSPIGSTTDAVVAAFAFGAGDGRPAAVVLHTSRELAPGAIVWRDGWSARPVASQPHVTIVALDRR
jgi:hypothetical protein